MLLRRREQEHRVVHGDREDHREEEHGPQALRKPCDSKPSRPEGCRPGRRAWLRRTPPPWRGGWSARRPPPAAAPGTASSRSRKPSTSTTATTSAVRDRRVRTRGRGSRPPRRPRAPRAEASARRRSIVRAAAVARRDRLAGTAWIRTSSSPRQGGAACTMPGSARRAPGPRLRWRRGPTMLERARGRPGPKPCCTQSYPCRDEADSGTTLMDGMPVSSSRTGMPSRRSTTRPQECRSARGGATAAQPSARTRASGARRRGPRAATSRRHAARASRAPPAAGSGWRRARRRRRA